MFRTLAVAALAAASAVAEDAIDLTIKMPKGQSWKVEQTLEITGTGGGRGGAAGEVGPLVVGGWVLKEAWTDEVTVDSGGRPLTVKRTLTSSKVGMAGKPQESTSIEAAVMTIEEKEKEPNSHVVEVKGKLPGAVIGVMAKGPIEPVTFLLPGKAVAVGAEWKINAQWATQFQRVEGASFGAAPHTTGLEDLLKESTVWGESPLGAELTCKITAVEKGEATIEIKGTKDGGIKKTEIAGKLKWNVAKGRPVSLEFTRTRTAMADEDKKTKEWKEEWKLTKSWK